MHWMISWLEKVSWKMCSLSEGTNEGRVIHSLNFQFESYISYQLLQNELSLNLVA